MSRFSHWSNAKLAAQMVFPRLDVDQYVENIDYRNNISELVAIGCGGFCVFGGNREAVSQITSELQIAADIPLLFCADFENGLPMRLEDGTSFPHPMALANAEIYTNEIAKAIAREAKDIGIHWNLAPVCDINSNPKNPVINIRSFGDSQQLVSKHIKEYIAGTQSENVLACAKHFPGHGNTDIDSHLAFPAISKGIDELEFEEIVPFVEAIEQNIKSIMVGHILFPLIDEQHPASLSKKIVYDILRNRIGYNGIITTDGLDMQSIVNRYDCVEIAELAIQAGNDILLIPRQPVETITAIENLLDKDTTLRKQVIASIERIMAAKQFAKLIPRFTKVNDNSKLFSEHLQLALRAAVASIKTEGFTTTNGGIIPDSKSYAAFSIVQKSEDIQSASRFFTMLAQATENDCNYAYLDENISETDLSDMADGVTEDEFVIFALFFRGRGYSKTLASADKVNHIIDRLRDNKEAVVIFFGDPYIAEKINCPKKILAFSDSFASLAAAVMLLTERKLN